jgi:hypothetical protein
MQVETDGANAQVEMKPNVCGNAFGQLPSKASYKGAERIENEKRGDRFAAQLHMIPI